MARPQGIWKEIEVGLERGLAKAGEDLRNPGGLFSRWRREDRLDDLPPNVLHRVFKLRFENRLDESKNDIAAEGIGYPAEEMRLAVASLSQQDGDLARSQRIGRGFYFPHPLDQPRRGIRVERRNIPLLSVVRAIVQ